MTFVEELVLPQRRRGDRVGAPDGHTGFRMDRALEEPGAQLIGRQNTVAELAIGSRAAAAHVLALRHHAIVLGAARPPQCQPSFVQRPPVDAGHDRGCVRRAAELAFASDRR